METILSGYTDTHPHDVTPMTNNPLSPPLDTIQTLLYAHYGRPEVDTETDDLLSELLYALLVQATNNHNASQAFGTLLERFDADWGRIANADVEEIQAAIEVGGLAKRKAPRVQAILKKAHALYGEYSLEPLHDESPDKAYKILVGMDGIGPKSATFVLMRAANMPFFSMSTRILRICQRLGWGSQSMSSQAAHDAVLPHIPDGEHDALHTVLIAHGKAMCLPSNPLCEGCPLRACCAHAMGAA